MFRPLLTLFGLLFIGVPSFGQASCGNPDEDAFFLPNSRIFCVDTTGVATIGFNLVNNGEPGDYKVIFPNGEDTTYFGVADNVRIERDFFFDCASPPGSPRPPTADEPFYSYEGELRIERIDCVDGDGDPPRQTYDFGIIPNPILNIQAIGESCTDLPFVLNISPVLCNRFLVESYQWFLNGEAVPGGTGPTLPDVRVNETGEIVVGLRVTNSRSCDAFYFERPVIIEPGPRLDVSFQVDSSQLCSPFLTIPVRTSASNVSTFVWTSNSDDVVFSDPTVAEPLITVNNSEPAERLIILTASNETCPSVADTLVLRTGVGQVIAVEGPLETCSGVPFDFCEQITYIPVPDNIRWSTDVPGSTIENGDSLCPVVTFGESGTATLVASGIDACGLPFREELTVTVRDGRPLSFDLDLIDTLCATNGPVNLLEYISPSANVVSISGPGVTDSIFDPGEIIGDIRLSVVDTCGSVYEIALNVVSPQRFNQPGPKVCLGEEIDLPFLQAGTYIGSGVDQRGVFRSTNVGVGTYRISYSSSQTCGITDTVVVIVEERPVADFTISPEGCEADSVVSEYATGQEITLQNASAATVTCYEVLETGLQICEQEFAVLNFDSAGTYTLRQIVSFPRGACQDTTERVIEVVAPIMQRFTMAVDSSSCDSFTIDLTALAPDTSVTYFWSFSSGSVSEEASPALRLPKPSSPEVVSARVTATNGCFVFRDTFDIVAPLAFRVDFGILNDNRTVCSGDTALLVDNSMAFDQLTVTFPDGSTASSLPERLVLTNPGDGILEYPITIRGTNRNCPPATYTDTLFILPVQTRAAFNLAYDESCSPASVILNNLSSPGASSLVFWGDGSTPEIVGNRDTAVHVFSTTVDTVFRIRMESSLCGTDIFTTDVPVYSIPDANFQLLESGSRCITDSLQFIPDAAEGANTLSWDFGDGTGSGQARPTHAYATPGLYTVALTVTTRNGCSSSSSRDLRIETYGGGTLSAVFPATTCVDSPLDLGVVAPAVSGLSYDYGNGLVSDQAVSIPYQEEGIYLATVTARDANGCRTDTSALIEVFPALNVTILPDSTTIEVELGDEVQLGFIIDPDRPLLSINWGSQDSIRAQFNQLSPVFLPTQDRLYRLTVGDEYGCVASDSVLVRVRTEYAERIYVPNVFSPNGDSRNDRFAIQAKPNTVAGIPYVRVLSRWGSLVYECRDCPLAGANEGWNGQVDGKDAPSGVYIWVSEIAFTDGTVQQFRGDVMLLR
jgi:gliding motility-associated-like protein